MDDEGVDSFEVPAAVVCAHCGEPDCQGCAPVVEDTTASGVVAIIPWERSDAGRWSRLWATASATTRGADAFFAVLPDGPLAPALRFALWSEILAVGSMLAGLLPLLAFVFPGHAEAVLRSPALRWAAVEWAFVGTLGLALWMVAAHVLHGLSLDVGARAAGAPRATRRALRFGLYSCGWDLMTAPVGIGYALAVRRRGFGALLGHAMQAPGRATAALLEGVYGLGARPAAKARRYGNAAAVLLAVSSGLGVVGGVIAALIG